MTATSSIGIAKTKFTEAKQTMTQIIAVKTIKILAENTINPAHVIGKLITGKIYALNTASAWEESECKLIY